jgi:5-methylcytosine-specific restriction endonuclease McrA
VRRRVLNRDGYVCGICGDMIDRYARPLSAMSAVVDHVIPYQDGGDPFDLANLRAAHLVCNSTRANRMRRRSADPLRVRRYSPPRSW